METNAIIWFVLLLFAAIVSMILKEVFAKRGTIKKVIWVLLATTATALIVIFLAGYVVAENALTWQIKDNLFVINHQNLMKNWESLMGITLFGSPIFLAVFVSFGIFGIFKNTDQITRETSYTFSFKRFKIVFLLESLVILAAVVYVVWLSYNINLFGEFIEFLPMY